MRHLTIIALAMLTLSALGAADVRLAADGRAAHPVVISANASPRVKTAAETLAKYLGQIADAKFEVNAGDGTSGIVVGVAADFANLAKELAADAPSPLRREDYVLRSHAQGVHLIGATDMAVEHAVWDLLHRLGHRQFFPGPHWEVVPRTPTLSIAVDTIERPAYHTRRIWYGFGVPEWSKQAYPDWCAKNRATSGLALNTGHAYDGILKANKAEFDKHPEYLGLVNGQRKSSKFCISNPGLRKLVVEHTLRNLDKDPTLDSVSADPSDGGGWCECDECAKLGSVTDRALTLANAMAEAVHAKKPGTLVGMYAYAYHSPPPTKVKAHPNVVISVATAFLKGGNSVDDVIAGWSTNARTLGIREYYSVNTWDRDLPGAARGGNLDYLRRTIPAFHAKAAKFMSAESSDNWGPNGLGYYLAARMLWNPREAENVPALVDDFLTRAFGPAKEPMRDFYAQLDGSKAHLVPANQRGQMFRAIEKALTLADTPAIKARLNDLVLYCRYVDLFDRYADARGEPRQQAYEALIRHAWRMRSTLLVHSWALYRDLAGRDKSVRMPIEVSWKTPEPKNPWKSSEPFTDAEIAAYVKEGVERYPLTKIDFEPVAYSSDLVPATKLNFPADLPPGNLSGARGRQTFHTYVANAPATIDLLITGGQIAHYRDRGNVKLDLYKLGGASQTGELETHVLSDRSVPPDGQEHPVKLPVKEPGIYKLTLDDGMDRTTAKWNCPLPLTLVSTIETPMNKYYADYTLYFYVPKGTKTLGFFAGDAGELCDATGKAVFSLKDKKPNFYGVPVPAGQAGKVWRITRARGPVRLLTVPPSLAPAAKDLLLPAEVVKRDM